MIVYFLCWELPSARLHSPNRRWKLEKNIKPNGESFDPLRLLEGGGSRTQCVVHQATYHRPSSNPSQVVQDFAAAVEARMRLNSLLAKHLHNSAQVVFPQGINLTLVQLQDVELSISKVELKLDSYHHQRLYYNPYCKEKHGWNSGRKSQCLSCIFSPTSRSNAQVPVIASTPPNQHRNGHRLTLSLERRKGQPFRFTLTLAFKDKANVRCPHTLIIPYTIVCWKRELRLAPNRSPVWVWRTLGYPYRLVTPEVPR